MKMVSTSIRHIHRLEGGYVWMEIHSPEISSTAVPGQFVMVRVSPTYDPLLRRPLGIAKREGESIWLYFQIIGKGTALLAEATKGDTLDIIGPLGHGFPTFENERILLVAGGRGIVPLLFFASEHAKKNQIGLLYGTKSKTDLHLVDEIGKIPFQEIHLYTEDGSSHQKGLVTSEWPMHVKCGYRVVLACGPHAMLNAIRPDQSKSNPDMYASLESLMGCGFGICHSCVIKKTSGIYANVCSEGPVFRMEELEWPI